MPENKRRICYRCMQVQEENSTFCPDCGFDITDPQTYPLKEINTALPAGSILAERYLVGCALCHDAFETVYAGLDLYSSNTTYIHEFFPSELADRRCAVDFTVSVISQEEKKPYLQGKEIYEKRYYALKNTSSISGSEHITSCFHENETIYMTGEAYSFISLKELLNKAPFSKNVSDYLAICRIIKNTLKELHASGQYLCDIQPERIFVGNGTVTILAGGLERYQFAKQSLSKCIKFSYPELSIENYNADDDIRQFSLLCYSMICSKPPADLNKITIKAVKKALMNAKKRYSIESGLLSAITTGMDRESETRADYSVLDKYTEFTMNISYTDLCLKNNKNIGTSQQKPPISIHKYVIPPTVLLAMVLILTLVFQQKRNHIPMPAETEGATPCQTTDKPVPDVTESPTLTPKASPLITPTFTPMPTESPTFPPTMTPKPTKQPTPSPKPTPKPTKQPTPSPKPTLKPTKKPTPEPTAKPIATPRPTKRPKPTQKPDEEKIQGIE